MAITKLELEGNYLQEEAEKLGFKSMQEYYQTLLTSGQTSALQTATQQYQTTAETAAQQASYDISGAYANYLKQQRKIATQGHLESGYKEALTNEAMKQYGSAYKEAQLTELQTLTEASQQASELYSALNKETTSMVEQVAKQYQKQAQTKANLFKVAEEFAMTKGDTNFQWYTTNQETGETEITPWGTEQYRSALLQYGDEFKTYLEEKGLSDELQYYLSDYANVHKGMFGFEETDYGVSEESKKAIQTSKLTTKGYAATVEKPSLDLQDRDFGGFKGTSVTDRKLAEGRTSLINYATTLGLEPQDYAKVLSEYDTMSSKVNTKQGSNEKLDAEKVNELYQQYLTDLISLSESKYGIENNSPEIKYTGGRRHLNK